MVKITVSMTSNREGLKNTDSGSNSAEPMGPGRHPLYMICHIHIIHRLSLQVCSASGESKTMVFISGVAPTCCSSQHTSEPASSGWCSAVWSTAGPGRGTGEHRGVPVWEESNSSVSCFLILLFFPHTYMELAGSYWQVLLAGLVAIYINKGA